MVEDSKAFTFAQEISREIFFKKYALHNENSVEEVLHGVADRIAMAENVDLRTIWAHRFYTLMTNEEFMPAGRVLANARIDSPMNNYMNCYVIPIKDSMEDIYTALRYDALIGKMGGGVGLNISTLRPKGAKISKGGESSGPMSFLEIFDASAKAIHTGGQRRCLPYDAPVFTEEGVKQIKNITVNDKVLTSDGFEKVTNVFSQGMQETIIIKTKQGDFECTPNHKMPIFTSVDTYIWKQAKDLVEGDRLVYVNAGIDGQETKLPSWNYTRPMHSTTCKDIVIPELTTDVAWFIGYLLGNGHIRIQSKVSKGNVSVACPNEFPTIISKVEKVLSLFGTTVRIKQGNGAYTIVCTESRQLALYFSQFKCPNEDIYIPACIMDGIRELRYAFVAGLFDADGSSKGRPLEVITTVYPSLVTDLRILLNSLGILSTVQFIDRGAIANWRDLYAVNLSNTVAVREWDRCIATYSLKYTSSRTLGYKTGIFDIGWPKAMITGSTIKINYKLWSTSSKQLPITTYERMTGKSACLYPIEVLKLTTGRLVDTYDVEVANKHEFVVNGFLTHNSAHMCVMNVDHPDIEEFITYKRGDGNKRLTQFNISVGVTDAFMRCVKIDGDWDLQFEGQVYKTVKAKYLYDLITTNMYQHNEPGVFFLDTVNRYNNGWYLYDIASPNPCVTGDTLILTDKGNVRIDSVVGQAVNVWNGFEYSEVIPSVTGYNQEIYDIEFSNGTKLSCTPYHKFILSNGDKIEAQYLQIGDGLTKWNLPIIAGNSILENAYAQGFFSGDGYSQIARNRQGITLYNDKKKLMPYLKYKYMNICHDNNNNVEEERIHLDITGYVNKDKLFVPNTMYSIKSRLDWLAGLLDSDGTNNSLDGSLAISANNHEFLLEIQYMLMTVGISCVVSKGKHGGLRVMPNGRGGHKEYITSDSYRLIICASSVVKLQELGLNTHRIRLFAKPNRIAKRVVRVKNILKRDMLEAKVYCFTEYKNHTGVFNGIMTSQCGEQPLPPYGCCCLGSLKLSTFVKNAFSPDAYFDSAKFSQSVPIAVRFLDDVLDTSEYPIAEVRERVLRERRVGLGITAIGDALAMLGYKYGSAKSYEFIDNVGQLLTLHSYRASIDLAIEKGAFPDFQSSMVERGYVSILPICIKERITEYGLRNMALNTIAPTGTTSLSLGNNCSSGIEPIFALEYTRNVTQLDGTFVPQPVYNEAWLKYKEVYGDTPPEYFVTTEDIPLEASLKVQAILQQYIDASISKTITLPDNFTKDEYDRLLLHAWGSGLKGITTYNPNGSLAPILTKKVLEKAEDRLAKKRPALLECDIHELTVNKQKMIVLVGKDSDDASLYEVFLTIDNAGGIQLQKAKQGAIRKTATGHYDLLIDGKMVIENITGIFDNDYASMCRLLSMAMRHKIPLQFIIDQLNKTKRFDTFAKTMARVLKTYITDGEKILSKSHASCPECASALSFKEGCLTCSQCGWSKC